MAFTKLTTDVENIQKLADRPQLSAQQLKAAFDGAGADIKQYLTETLVPELEAGHSGESVSETEGEIYGIGIEKGAGNLFWFHKEVRRTPGN